MIKPKKHRSLPGRYATPQCATISLFLFSFLISCAFLASCTVRPLKGGKAANYPTPTGGLSQTLQQGDNPAASTRQDQETVKIRTYILPAGSRLEQPSEPPSSSAPSTLNPQLSTFILSAPTPVTERLETRAKTELGAAQKDTARELAAKLSSLKGIVWVGVALFIFGLASIFWPPLKLIIGSITTSAAITLGGLALIILPTLIVGNELLIFGGVALAVGAWFLAHRHGHLRGQLAATQPQPPPSQAKIANS